MCLGLRLLFLLVLICAPLRVEAGQNCGQPGKSATLAPLTVSGRYDPTAAAGSPMAGTLVFSAPVSVGPCVLWVTYADQGNNKLLGPGGAVLAYGESGAFWSLEYGVLNESMDGSGLLATQSGTLEVGAGQKVPPGTYSQQRVINLKTGGGQLLSQSTLTVSVSVASACTLPAPGSSSLDFSAGIANGHISQGYRQSTAIVGASCTGPGMLTVRGGAMSNAQAAAAGFRNSIDYVATATLGSLSASLSTAAASQASVSVPAAAGTLNLDISLVDGGRPLVAGSYKGTVSVLLEPSN